MLDYLIVGQGIAGSLLAWFLQEEGFSVAIVDDGRPNASSRVAAGLINPITGRRFVKSWRIDELLPFAQDTYRRLEAQLGVKIYHPFEIVRAIYTVQEENLWLERCADPAYRPYVSDAAPLGVLAEYVAPARAFGLVKGGARVALPELLRALAQRWAAQGALVQASFDFSQLRLGASYVEYDKLRARRIVFCGGYRDKLNPLFPAFPLAGDKGEACIVRFQGAPAFERILKHKVFVIPLENGTYWAGANYAHRFDHELPTEAGYQWLADQLRQSVACPFEVLAHQAAVRPTVPDRRPLMGQHSACQHVFIFNGLGTKGASLGPFWAHHFVQYLAGRAALDEAVHWRRFG